MKNTEQQAAPEPKICKTCCHRWTCCQLWADVCEAAQERGRSTEHKGRD